MKNSTLISIVAVCAVSVLLAGCFNNNASRKQKSETDIVTSTIMDSTGAELQMTFDNAAGTATFVFKGDTIHLTQDTMASGIRYNNNDYVYLEWQGHCMLYKDSLIVFNLE